MPENPLWERPVGVKYYIHLILTVLVWGLMFPLYKRCTESVGFLATGAMLFLVATVLLGGILLGQGRVRHVEAVAAGRRIPYGRLLLIGLVSFALNGLALAAAQHTSVVNISTLSRTDVLFSLLLSALIFREKVDLRAMVFLPIMIVGICLLTGMITKSPELGQPGDFLILASALLVALNAFFIKSALRDVRTTMVGLCNMLANAVAFSICIFILGDPARTLASAGWEAWAMGIALGVMTAALCVTYYTALTGLPVWEVRLFCLGIPVVATLAAWAWLDDVPTTMQWLGMLAVGAGTAGLVLSRRRRMSGERRHVHQ